MILKKKTHTHTQTKWTQKWRQKKKTRTAETTTANKMIINDWKGAIAAERGQRRQTKKEAKEEKKKCVGIVTLTRAMPIS